MSRRVNCLALSGLLGLFVLSCLVVETADAQRRRRRFGRRRTECCQPQPPCKGCGDRRVDCTNDYCRVKSLGKYIVNGQCVFEEYRIEICNSQGQYATIQDPCCAKTDDRGCSGAPDCTHCATFLVKERSTLDNIYVPVVDQPGIAVRLGIRNSEFERYKVGELKFIPTGQAVSTFKVRFSYTSDGQEEYRYADVQIVELDENAKVALAVECTPSTGPVETASSQTPHGNGMQVTFKSDPDGQEITFFVYLLKQH